MLRAKSYALYMRRRHKFSSHLRCAVLETEGPGASQPVSKKLGLNPALSFQRLVSKTKLLTVYSTDVTYVS